MRWFEWGAFQPVMRAHGERNHNEVWAYGKQAEPILAKYLRLRYQLLPYTYSAAYRSYETGAPYMRALFMDFPDDPKAADIPDEYMYGPAFLVAPVTEQGATHRTVYLPAGWDWYNYWTNERLHGGQTITVDAPIDTLPLFVRAGSIVPLGSEVLSASLPQTIVSVRVYPGANGSFTLFQDDGKTYGYEKGAGSSTRLTWDDAAHQLKHDGAAGWNEPDKSVGSRRLGGPNSPLKWMRSCTIPPGRFASETRRMRHAGTRRKTFGCLNSGYVWRQFQALESVHRRTRVCISDPGSRPSPGSGRSISWIASPIRNSWSIHSVDGGF